MNRATPCITRTATPFPYTTLFRSRADDDHGTAMGFVGVGGEFTGDLDRLLAGHAGDDFLPGRGAGHAGVVVAGSDVGATQTTVDTEVGGHQVEYGGDLGDRKSTRLNSSH